MAEQILKVTAEHLTGPLAVLRATGEIDRDSIQLLGDAAQEALDRGAHRLIIDLAAVTFCDSSGLRLFVQLHRQTATRGGSLRLAALQPPLWMVLQATNLDRLLAAHPTVDEAVRAASA